MNPDAILERKPMPEIEIKEEDRTLGTVLVALETLRHKDLLSAADTIMALGDAHPARPLRAYKETELRALLKRCAKTLYKRDPDTLTVVENFLDAIGRARLKRSAQQNTSPIRRN